MNINKRITKTAGFLIVAIIFYFLGRQLYHNWNQLAQYEWNINVYILLLSFLILLFCHGLVSLGLKFTLSLLGEKISFRNIFRINYLSELGKYVPGKIWSVAGSLYLADKIGLSKFKMLLARILFVFIHITGGLILFFTIYFFIIIPVPFLNRTIPAIFVVSLALVLLHPAILEKLINFILIRISKKNFSLTFNYSYLLLLVPFSMLIWIIYGVWFFVFTKAVFPVSITDLWRLTAFFFLSWFSGFLVFIVPSGLGVREGVMTMLLKPLMPLPMAIAIPLLLRIATIAGDLMTFFIAMSFKKNEEISNYQH